MTRKQQILVGFLTGVAFLLLLLHLVSTTPCPTTPQKYFYQVVLALSAAAFAAIIPGVLDVKLSNGVTAGGAFGVLVLVFFFVPKNYYTGCPPAQLQSIHGQVFVNGSLLKDVVVSVPVLERRAETNDFGIFEIHRFPGQEQLSYQLVITFNSQEFVVDTTITVKDGPSISNLTLTVFAKPKARLVNDDLTPNKEPVLTIYEYHLFNTGFFANINYGGVGFCTYTARLNDLKLTVALDADRSTVLFASLNYNFTEHAPGCPHPTLPANLNTFTMTDWKIDGDQVELNFQPDPANTPQCTVRVTCTRKHKSLRGLMTVRRFDSSGVFNFQSEIPITLALDIP